MSGVEQPREPKPLASSGTQERLFTIGQVVKQLISDFPDVSISKVRYLEDRGIITPRRTSGGYRKYAAADVHRLRTALQLQRDQYLPLNVIKDRLDRGTASAVSGAIPGSHTPERSDALIRQESEMTWDEALEVLG